MKIEIVYIVNAHTTLEEMIQDPMDKELFTLKEIFEMGQFYEWSKQFITDEDIDLSVEVEVPEDIKWVVGETQSW